MNLTWLDLLGTSCFDGVTGFPLDPQVRRGRLEVMEFMQRLGAWAVVDRNECHASYSTEPISMLSCKRPSESSSTCSREMSSLLLLWLGARRCRFQSCPSDQSWERCQAMTGCSCSWKFHELTHTVINTPLMTPRNAGNWSWPCMGVWLRHALRASCVRDLLGLWS